jgi:hypothetical protein
MKHAAGVAAVALAVLASGGAARAQAAPARLVGTFTMAGTVTVADDVYGERAGEHVRRTWHFVPQCGNGWCRRVLLKRRRSGQHILDEVMLVRQPSGGYVGKSRFWVPLRCAGALESRGGVATETITVRITAAQLVGTTRFATAISATYANPSRTNLTHCSGGIGHDAAQYQGRLTSPLPGAPAANGTWPPTASRYRSPAEMTLR